MKRALLVYYTLTGQAQRAVDAAARALSDAGWEAVPCRIDFADTAERPQRPFKVADSKRWVDLASAGTVMAMTYDPPAAIEGDYDLVLVFTNTWAKHPSVPVHSFLHSAEGARVLSGRPFAIYAVCRRLYDDNVKLVREAGEAAGGRFVGSEAFIHWGGQIGSLIQTVTYIHRADGGLKSLFGMIPLPSYGLSDKSLARIAPFTREVIGRV